MARVVALLLLCVAAMALSACAHKDANGRPAINHIRFRGLEHLDQGDLAGKIATRQKSWIPFAATNYLDAFELHRDIPRIESYLQAHGYFRGRVLATQIIPYKKNRVDVEITVAQGPPTRIATLQITGLHSVDPKLAGSIGKSIKLAVGDIFDDERFESTKQEIIGRLKAGGYAWADARAHVEVDRDASTAQVELDVEPGEYTRIHRIVVQGERRIPERLIALHSMLVEGQAVTPQALDAARGHLFNLSVFSSVKVGQVRNAEDPTQTDVVVTVQEGPFREWRLGGGIGFEFQRNEVRARAIYTRRNFLGGLRVLQLRLEPAYVVIPEFWNVHRKGPAAVAEAAFTQPDAFTPHDQLKVTVGYDLGIDYAYQDHGPRGQLAYSRPFFHHRLQLSVSYNFQLLLFFATDPTILQDPALARRLFGYVDPYRLGWYEEDISLDLRDRPLDARKGVYLALHAEEGGNYAGGAFEYEKISPDARVYAPLGRRVVLAARAQFGQMFVQGDLGSPITRRFYLGGPDSHRGFNYNRLSLQVPSGISGVPPLPIGGDQLFLAQAEVRVQILRLFGYWVEGAAFADGGDVAAPSCQGPSSSPAAAAACHAVVGGSTTHIDFSDLHWAVGFGLRYKTIVGTIRGDLGIRLNRLSPFEANGVPNPDPGSRFALHISIGEPF